MSELAGRVFCVTGANTGIGRVTALELARRGATTILACRSESKTQPVLDAIRDETGNEQLEFVPLDLGDFDSVRACAQTLLDRDGPLHVLINNAGLAGPRGLTQSGFELAFGVNHLGHFLLTQLLIPKLRSSTPARIVNVSSKSHYRAKGIDFEAVRRETASVSGLPEYEASKLANVLYTKALARRLTGSGVTTYALHPGVVATDIWQRRIPRPIAWLMSRFMISPEQGAETTLYCATDPAVADASGLYYDSSKEKYPSRVSQDEALSEALWARSLEWTGAPDLALAAGD